MEARYLLGVDVGTTSVKVAIIREDGKVQGISSSSYSLITPTQNEVQMDVEDMWRSYLKCIELLFRAKDINPEKIKGIGISCLCPGLTAFGESGEILVEPILYSDRRSIKEAEEITEKVGKECLFGITANHAMAGAISGTSMLWIKNHCPQLYKKTKYFGHINTFMAQRMTGKYAMDYSNASYTALFETVKGQKGSWSEFLCKTIGIDKEKLPPLLASSKPVGGLTHPELINMGIPENIPVVIGGADTPCASLAAGVIQAGDVCESVGTTNVLTVCVDEPRFDERFINRCHVVDGTWLYQGAMSHTGASYQWFRDNFCQDLKELSERTGKDVFTLMNEEAELAAPGSEGTIFLPYMLGERSPVWDPYARGVFFGLSLQHKRKHMNRAVMEGCGYGLRQLCEIAEDVTGKEIRSFSSIGGGAKSKTWSQIKADITGRDIYVLDLNDMAPIGAALLAGIGAGIYQDVEEATSKIERKVYCKVKAEMRNQDIYEKQYQIYQELYPNLKQLYRTLGRM